METEGGFPGGRRAAGADGRRADAESTPRKKEVRDEKREVAPRGDGACRESISRRRWQVAAGPRRGALSSPTALSITTQLKFPPWLRAGTHGPLRSKAYLGKQGVQHVEDMWWKPRVMLHTDRRRRHSGSLRPLPRPRDVSDHRFSWPHHCHLADALHRPTRRRAKYLNSPETPLFHKGSDLSTTARWRGRRSTVTALRWSSSRAMSM